MQDRRARRALAVSAALLLTACSDRDIESIENALWKTFAGHPKPIILEMPAPPVYCYNTSGEPQCYAEPLEGERAVPIE